MIDSTVYVDRVSNWLHIFLTRTAEAFPELWWEIPTAVLLTVLWCGLARIFPSLFSSVAARFSESVKHPGRYVVAAMLLPAALRLACLPWIPPPQPKWHDEFSQLLVADTLAHGRLANPPHPLARHFETIYVLQTPTYSSTYPPGQGIIMAVGEAVTGRPWAGVLVAVALMCGSITWMLNGCLPAPWAVMGGLLGTLTYGLADEWIDSYYGGAFCAFGGALLFGSLFRLRRSPSRGLALLAGLGWSVIWLIRPYESLHTLLFSWCFLAIFAWQDSGRWKRWITPAALMLGVQGCAGILTAAHDRAVTGSYTTMPYQLSQRKYGVPQSFLWQKPIQEPALNLRELKAMYEWQRGRKDLLDQHPFRRCAAVIYNMWLFFVTPWFTLPVLMAGLLLIRDYEVRAAVALLAVAAGAGAFYPFFAARYIAAYSGIFLYLIVRGLMVLYNRSLYGKPAVCLVVAGACLAGPASFAIAPATLPARAQIVRELLNTPGRHAVFVRYGPTHDFHDEWVYNAADIDASRIVWCRAMGPADDAEVARYYRDRKLWLVDAGEGTGKLSPYAPGP